MWPSAAPRMCTGRAEWRRGRSLASAAPEVLGLGSASLDLESLPGIESVPGLRAMGLETVEVDNAKEPKKEDDMLKSLFAGVGSLSPVSQLSAGAAETGPAEMAETAGQLPGQVDDGLLHINNKTTFHETESGSTRLNLRRPSGDYQCPPASSLTGTSRAEHAAEIAAATATAAAHRRADAELVPAQLALKSGAHERISSLRRTAHHVEVEEIRRGKALAVMRNWAAMQHGRLKSDALIG